MKLSACYNAGMPTKRVIPLPVKVAAEEKAALEKIKDFEDRPLGYLARAFMLRGLAAYKRDGLLREPENGHKIPVVTVKDKSKGERRKTG